jgi:tRNA(fMet)-specific endonuclease VapC
MAVHLRQFAVIDSDRALCREWAKVRWQMREDGFEIRVPDAWVAATALLYDVPLVTHNRQDFSRVKGVKLISEAPI